jgi:hypothetical protein
MENSMQSLIDRQLVQSDFLAKENADLPDWEALTNTAVPHKRRAK